MGHGTQPEFVDATFYATIEPQWSQSTGAWGTDEKDRPILKGAKVTSLTQGRPRGRAKAGALVTRLTLRIEANAMLPLQPEVVIHVNAGNAELIEVTADAPEPDDEDPT